ncbi:hypothetical protein FOA43_002245 [Brettanomyces nanus]|uniref:Uncharacterized protein n=1 Tax=Eeniella nana TaxID=13502 RepID=A0A875RUS8_EENNA|nr:uncharacterized protein FOA43_002245 [Brettanomyces nanus]QPG74907.1 hypothetical protein FOA43_002245 [Brettanomyces nanus]
MAARGYGRSRRSRTPKKVTKKIVEVKKEPKTEIKEEDKEIDPKDDKKDKDKDKDKGNGNDNDNDKDKDKGNDNDNDNAEKENPKIKLTLNFNNDAPIPSKETSEALADVSPATVIAAEEPSVSDCKPSAILGDVLTLLDLSYDDTSGLIQGDAMFKVPELNELEKANDLFQKLIVKLGDGVARDTELLQRFSVDEPENAEKQPESPHGRRHTIIKISGGSDGESKIRIRTETTMTAEDDEDEVGPPVKRRRRSIILTANGLRREITPNIADSEEEEEEEETTDGGSIAKKEAELEDSDDVHFLPSVYAHKPNPNFPIREMLKPAIEQLDLYDDEKAKEESSDEREYLKQKLAVTDFPQSDLKDYLPGEIPTKDLSVNRPTNQVAFNSFQNYVEPFFRNFTDEDVSFLRQNGVFISHLPKDFDDKRDTFEIPGLGPWYGDVWKEEERISGEMNGEQVLSGNYISEIRASAQKRMDLRMHELTAARGSAEALDNNALEGEEQVSCGPLTSRLLSAIVGEEEFVRHKEEEQEQATGIPVYQDLSNSGGPKGSSSELPGERAFQSEYTGTDYKTLDDRLKRELRYIGVYMNVQQTLDDPGFEQDWSQKKEDDEICCEMRKLQKQLKEVQKRNIRRKKVMIPIIEEQIAWQEYMSVLEDLDKQVEQHYRRRINVTPRKSRKRALHHKDKDITNDHKEDSINHLVTSASFQSLLAKRAKWIEKIGPLFKSQREMRRMPDESIFKNMNEEDENDGEEGEDIEGDGEDEDDDDDDVLGAHKNDDDQVEGESLNMVEE